MFCYKCGAEISDNAKFCNSCGAPQLPENEAVKMRMVKRTDGPAAVYNRPEGRDTASGSSNERPVNTVPGGQYASDESRNAQMQRSPKDMRNDQGQPQAGDMRNTQGHQPDDGDKRKRNIALIIIIIAIAAAAVVIFLLFFRDRIGLPSKQTSEAVVSADNDEGERTGGSADITAEIAASDSSRADSTDVKNTSAADADDSSSEENTDKKTADQAEDADKSKTGDVRSDSGSASADKSAASDKTASSEKASSSDKSGSETERSASERSSGNETASSGRPKITGNNTDQMALPGTSQGTGTAQTAVPTVSPADTAVASVVMASTVSISNYNKAVVQTAKASSELQQPGYDNSVASAIDNNVITSWQDGVDGYGEGQVIDLTLDKEYQIHCINFNLGNWRDQQNYNENSRPKQVTLYLGTERYYTVIFPDGMSQYSVLFSADVPASWIRVQIDSVYPGALYDDTCISEIAIYASN